jgi:RHH-type proline utilization regulon transcriptional repressor/proline dehydrogenase/delta 1-pyrroline-5-carboxylate dehydrogenase
MPVDLDSRIVERGRRLYDRIEEDEPSFFEKDYWTSKVLDWCMNDEAFKVEMFRFVDVFPALGESKSVAQHLREYFARPGQEFPELLQWAIKTVDPDSLAAGIVSRGIGANIRSMGRQFIVGETPEDALAKLRELRKHGLAFTMDILGEAVVSEPEAEDYARRYQALLDVMNGEVASWDALGTDTGVLDWGSSPKINVSVKASAMYSQMKARAFEYSIDRAKERLRPILRRAMEIGAFVNVDMEHHSLKNLTLALYRSLMEEPEFRGYPHTGIAMQAYLRNTKDDVADLIAWCRAEDQNITIRLVKGAYWDAEVMWARQNDWPVPVFTNKHESDANFESAARLVLGNHQYLTLACGSHNIRSISAVIETAHGMRVPEDRLEFQILYGMSEPIRNALLKEGLRLRLYSPIGELVPGMAYLVRRLLENTSNESFLRQSFTEHASRDELLRSPGSFLSGNDVAVETEAADEENPPGAAAESFRNVPPLDWALAENRDRFAEALRKVREGFPVNVPLFVDGKEIETEKRIRSLNPNQPEEEVGVAASANAEHAGLAIAAAQRAFAAWRDTSPADRAEFLFKAAKLAREKRYELAALQVFEAGKNWSEADGDVCEAVDFLEYYGREMLRLGAPREMGDVPGEESLLSYEPRGVVSVIAPWNFPLAISVGMVSAALVTGNTVVYKPASDTPITGSMVYRLFEEAGLPAGVLNYLPGSGGEIGDLLVTHPDVTMTAFTGSVEVGLRIIRLSAETPEGAAGVKRVVAEMGGKNAIIVDSDADLDEAVLQILHSAFGYQGQKCSACSRLIVLEAVHDKLVERLKAAAESIHLGPTEAPRTYMGAVISESAKRKIEEYIEIGKQEGTLVLERLPANPSGSFVPLTIFKDIRPEHRLAQEEIFGPVLSVIKAKDFDDAIEIANRTQYALTGALFSRSPNNIAKAKQQFRVGNLYINRGCTGAIVNRHPFGGFKMSGVGSKAGGPDYLMQFLLPRNIVENTIRRGFAPDEGFEEA